MVGPVHRRFVDAFLHLFLHVFCLRCHLVGGDMPLPTPSDVEKGDDDYHNKDNVKH